MVSFIQSKTREKHPWGSDALRKVKPVSAGAFMQVLYLYQMWM